MTPDRIKFTQEFERNGVRTWIGMEGTVTEGENFIEATKQANELVKKSFDAIIPVKQVREEVPYGRIDEEFEKVKAGLSVIVYREEAQEYAEKHGFQHTIEIKNLINQKPSKNE